MLSLLVLIMVQCPYDNHPVHMVLPIAYITPIRVSVSLTHRHTGKTADKRSYSIIQVMGGIDFADVTKAIGGGDYLPKEARWNPRASHLCLLTMLHMDWDPIPPRLVAWL